MNFLYWNVNKKNLSRYVIDACIENNIDVAILTEHESIDIRYIKRKLSEKELEFNEEIIDPKSRVLLLKKSNKNVSVIKERPYYSVYKVKDGEDIILIFGIHLPSATNQDIATLDMHAVKISGEIDKDEEILNCDKSIVVGDFNLNPFNKGMVSPMGFNAVMTQEIAKKETRSFLYNEKRFYYNPMWHLMGNIDNLVKGTFYYPQDSDSCYWHTLDQVLIRPGVIEKFDLDELKIIHKIKDVSLLNENNLPDKKISDHLPIVYRLKLEVEHE